MGDPDHAALRGKAPFERTGVHSFDVPVLVPQPVRAFIPMNYPAGRPYPLLALLHGRGANHDDFVHLGQLISPEHYIALSLRGMEICAPRSDGEIGFGWGREPSLVEAAEQYLQAALRTTLSTYHADPRRVFLVGHAQGAALAFKLVARQPERFAGVVSLGGWLPNTADRLTRPGPEIERLHFFIGHGLHDRVVPLAGAQRAVGRLSDAGADVTYRTYSCGHRISRRMLQDIDAWIMALPPGETADG